MQSIDALFAPFDAPGMPGACVLVRRAGEVVVRRAYGLAGVEAGTRATPETNYRLASLSKPFTAASVLLLVAEDRIGLDEPVAHWLGPLPQHAASVTVRHLLTHTSGLADYEDWVPAGATKQLRDADVLALLAEHGWSASFAPGSSWRYSNTGYALLALIVERVSGLRYAEFLRARIFEPLGMQGSVAHEEGRSTVPHRAIGHDVRGGVVIRADRSPTSAVLGDGGIYSSIDDLARWDAALEAGALLPAGLWRQATTPHVLPDGTPTEYGFGWFVDEHRGRRRLRHHGETAGFTHSIYRFPERRLTTIVLTNRCASAPWELNDRVCSRYLEGPQSTSTVAPAS